MMDISVNTCGRWNRLELCCNGQANHRA